jgi:gamma-glutamyltranspeptidase/glutathione hydrolase
MVCTAHPAAAQAGLEILKSGGNAVDAAVACAAALTVVEPTSNGIGSDAFAIIWQNGRMHGLNASGPIPAAMTMFNAEKQGWTRPDATGHMPAHGWAPVTVPGAPLAWATLTKACGKLSLNQNLGPAIALARQGHAVSATVASSWRAALRRFGAYSGGEFKAWFDCFAPEGRTPLPGEIWRSSMQADTLERIADSAGRDLYDGELSRALVSAALAQGGHVSLDDLGNFSPEWVEPLGMPYRDYTVWEIPPNGQGIAALSALGVMAGLEPGHRDDPDAIHRQIEAMKLGFADAHRHVADPRFCDIPLSALLDPAYLEARRCLIGTVAEDRQAGMPLPGGTVYLCTADAEGTMVSYIQSNYMGFGSGIVVPRTGIALNNRGHCFSLQPGHPNMLEPGKRPYNTIIPGFITKDGQAIGPFGVMGGFMQPQGHLQLVMNAIDYRLNPQQALDAPRWQWIKGNEVLLEPGYAPSIAASLGRMGHQINYGMEPGSFGRGQIIWRSAAGSLIGATEPRADGCAAAW